MIKVHILYFGDSNGCDNLFVCYTLRELYETLFAQLDDGDEDDFDAATLKNILDEEDYGEAEFRIGQYADGGSCRWLHEEVEIDPTKVQPAQ
jgi:hypothetical protein